MLRIVQQTLLGGISSLLLDWDDTSVLAVKHFSRVTVLHDRYNPSHQIIQVREVKKERLSEYDK